MSSAPLSSTPPDSVNLFLHFLDSHFIKLIQAPSGALALLKKEARLALRFAILAADQVLIPAAYFFETPICREIILEHEALLSYAFVHLIGGGGNLVEYAGEKQEQYDEKSPLHRGYFEPLPSIYPPFLNRTGSATGDISGWWGEFLNSPEFATLFKRLKYKSPRGFERKWEEVPERLEHRAFIMENVTRLLFKGNVPPLLLNRIQRKVDSWYFESFINEFDAGIIRNLSYFHAPYYIKSNGLDLYYGCALKMALDLGIHDLILNADPLSLLKIKNCVQWGVCMEACAKNIAERKNLFAGLALERQDLHLAPRLVSITSVGSRPFVYDARGDLPVKDIFVSYNKADRAWAEWIAWVLEEAAFSVEIQAWDSQPGANFVEKMHLAAATTKRTVAVLSEDYLKSGFTAPEWQAAFAKDPKGQQRTLIPFRVRLCQPDGLLGQVVYADLVGLTEDEAQAAILGAMSDRAKPAQAPAFPGTAKAKPAAPSFPGQPAPGKHSDLNKIVQTVTSATRGSATETPLPASLSSAERIALHQQLNQLSPQQFNIILFALNPPAGLIPPMPAPQGDRVTALLLWAESPAGCGLGAIVNTSNSVLNP